MLKAQQISALKKLPATFVGYDNGSLAIQDLINGNVKYVIIDAAPASAITTAINCSSLTDNNKYLTSVSGEVFFYKEFNYEFW